MAKHSLEKKASNRSFPGFTEEIEGKWKGPFCFIQGADTQLGLIERYIEKKKDPGWQKEIELTKATIEAVNAIVPRPRFFVVCGDLIDAMPGTELRSAQEVDFIKLFKQLHPDIPLICVCGNHDVGDTPTHESIEEYCKKFGDDYFTFFCGGVMFIVLNSQLFEDNRLVLNLAEKQEAWLNEQLDIASSRKYKHVIIFQHIPWFVTSINEEKCYFNLLPELREKWLQKFLDCGVRYIFCGHWHGNSGGFYKDLEQVVTSAIGGQLRGDKSGYRVVLVDDEKVNHEYYELKCVNKEDSSK